MKMTENNNSEYKGKISVTPKKRMSRSIMTSNLQSNINGDNEQTAPTIRMENKKSRVGFVDDFYVDNSPLLQQRSYLTPLNIKRRSQDFKKYCLVNDSDKTELDVTNEIKELDTYKKKKIEIFDNLNLKFKFNDSYVCVSNLDPDEKVPEEKYIISYPKLFDYSICSKFVEKVLVSSTRLSEIYMSRHRFNGQYYIVKSGYSNDTGCMLSSSSREIINELKILTLIGKHPHVVDYFDAWIEDERFHLQLEYVQGGSLMDFLVGHTDMNAICDISYFKKVYSLSSTSAFVLLAQMASLLIYMHDELHIFHGDIKPSNIVVRLLKFDSNTYSEMKYECHLALQNNNLDSKLRFKLCDFGRSCATDFVSQIDDGDARYLPALNDNCPSFHSKATSRDIYSLGMTLFDCLGGTVCDESVRYIRKGNMENWPENMSEEWRIIIKKMTHVDAQQRITARELFSLNGIKELVLPESMNFFENDKVATALSSDPMETF